MKLTKIIPRGFCKGVVDAWVAIEDYAKKNQDKKIYMVGWFVHNQFMIEKIEQLGIITIDDSNKSRLEIIENLNYQNNGVLIFSCHGTNYKAIDLAIDKGFEVLDLTCIFVKKIQEIVKQKIEENKKIIFLGSKNHPESISIKSIDEASIEICENIEEIKNFLNQNQNEKIFFTNQTTICLSQYQNIIQYIEGHKDFDIEIKNDICLATIERQQAIHNLENDVDLLIVVGDSKSNNSNNLRNTGIQKNIETILIDDVNQIDDNIFLNRNHVAITSGASTPTWITNEVIKYVEKKCI